MASIKEISGLLILALSLSLPSVVTAAQGEPDIDAEPVVNINQAGPDELAEALDGVGKSKARAIVDYREENGGFESPSELTSVDGIGSVTLEDNRDRIQLE